MKTKINVIDLDGTLLPYDSFRRYVYRFLRRRKSCVPIAVLILLRQLRGIDAVTFKKHVVSVSRRISSYQQSLNEFSNRIIDDFEQEILLQIEEHTDHSTINILCSASPEDYVSIIANKLSWQCIASKFDRGSSGFLHMYGKNKVAAIQEKYPTRLYDYNFAISDSPSDIKLLTKFEHHILKQ